MKKISTLIIAAMLLILSLSYLGCGGSRSLANMTAAELYALGQQEYNNKKYIRAVTAFQNVVYNYPGESIVDSAQYMLAMSYFGAEEYELAQVEFNRLLISYPSSVYFEHAVFLKAVSFFEGTPKHYGLDQTDLETATKQFEDYLIDYPESDLRPQAEAYLLKARTRMAQKYYQAGVVYDHMSAHTAAIKYFQKVVDDYTDTEFGAKATFGIADMEFKRKNYDEARKRFRNFLTVFPDHEFSAKAVKLEAEAAYKSGKLAFEQGKFTEARERFEIFIKDFPENKQVKNANKYLKQIEAVSAKSNGNNDANS